MAVRFDTSGERFSRTTNLLSTGGPWTVSFWALWSAFPGAGVYGTVFYTGGVNYGSPGICYFGTLANVLVVGAGNTWVEDTGSTLSTNTWYHIAIVRGATANTNDVYVNGALDASIAAAASGTSARIDFGCVGTTNGDPFNGRVSSIFIYTAALSVNEIVQIGKSFSPAVMTNIQTWTPALRHDDLADYSGVGGAWTANGTISTEDGPPIPWMHSRRSYVFIPAAGGDLYTATLAGAITPIGTIVKQVNKVLLGTNTPTGSLSKVVGKVLSGAVAISGGLRKTANKVVTGALSLIGTLSTTSSFFGLYRQSNGDAPGTVLSDTLAFPQSTAAGGIIVVAARYSNDPGSVTITDTLGNTYNFYQSSGGAAGVTHIFASLNGIGGSDTVTITMTNSVAVRWIISEYYGPGIFGVTNKTEGGVGTAITSGNLVTAIPTGLIIGVGVTANTRDYTAGTDFTERQEIEQRVALEDRVVSSTGTYTATWSINASDTWSGLGVTFHPTAFGIVLNGSIALVGSLVKVVNKGLFGTVTPIGALSVALRRAISLVGSVIPVGSLVKRVEKVFGGAVVPVGSVTKQIDKILSGSVGVSGVVVKQVNKILAGIVSGVGSLISDVIEGGGTVYTATLAGAVGLSGALTKQVNKVLGGTVTPVGAVSKVVGKVLQGSVGVSGSLVKGVGKVFGGVVIPIGVVVKRVDKIFTGTVIPVGALTRSYIRSIVLSGVITPIGALVSSVIAGSGVVLRTMYPLFRRKRR